MLTDVISDMANKLFFSFFLHVQSNTVAASSLMCGRVVLFVKHSIKIVDQKYKSSLSPLLVLYMS